MRPVILYRPCDGLDTTEEDAAQRWLRVVRSRAQCGPGDLVIGRYSVLPFYAELENDLGWHDAKLINTHRQHQFVADVLEWVPILNYGYGDDFLTPRTWDVLADLPEDGTQFVVKGQTNSRKDRWNTHMFARNKREAVEVTLRLQEDSLISNQKIYYREYVPLWRLMTGFNDLPITEEFRYFVLDGKILSSAFYWSSHVADLEKVPVTNDATDMCVVTAINQLRRAGDVAPRFVVIDVARREDGRCMIVELNDGQMSGLSENSPDVLYKNIAEVLSGPEARRK